MNYTKEAEVLVNKHFLCIGYMAKAKQTSLLEIDSNIELLQKFKEKFRDNHIIFHALDIEQEELKQIKYSLEKF